MQIKCPCLGLASRNEPRSCLNWLDHRSGAYCLASTVPVSQSEIARAEQIQAWSITAFDALHLACAESGQANIFLTTDDRLLRKAPAHTEQLRVRVENPLVRLREVSQ